MSPQNLDKLVTQKLGIPLGPDFKDASHGCNKSLWPAEYTGKDEEGGQFFSAVRGATGEILLEPTLLPLDMADDILRDPGQHTESFEYDPDLVCLTAPSPEEIAVANLAVEEKIEEVRKRRKMSRERLLVEIGLTDTPPKKTD
ncbi:hypothetical protein JXA05_02335 [Candidatus Peregrinibacteria bacterium]|nr:hypothetical protein [Candidatus Peregrinibacteria bacterium]